MNHKIQEQVKALEGERGPYWLPDGVAVPGQYQDNRAQWVSFVEGFHHAAEELDALEAVQWRRTDEQWVAYHTGFEAGVAWKDSLEH